MFHVKHSPRGRTNAHEKARADPVGAGEKFNVYKGFYCDTFITISTPSSRSVCST